MALTLTADKFSAEYPEILVHMRGQDREVYRMAVVASGRAARSRSAVRVVAR